jgi:CubicO group peptidase (beta-lactamase class C family)
LKRTEFRLKVRTPWKVPCPAVALLVAAVTGMAASEAPIDAQTGKDQVDSSISASLGAILARHKLPALAVAVVSNGRIVTINAAGVRQLHGDQTVTVQDKFHIGSITKSMTATVAAMLVEQGKISWTTTIRELFPDLGVDIPSDHADVTLEQLLAHRGGMPEHAPRDLWIKAWNANGTPAEQRLEFARGMLGRRPEMKKDAKYIYSNAGYTVAGVMLERASGKTWEELMRTMLFEPLGMESAGFGPPASAGKVDQPWGHRKLLLGGLEPVPPGPMADNPLAISPAGAVHCSVRDLAKYAAFHLAGNRGAGKFLDSESFKKLHMPVGDGDYSLGWVVVDREWARGKALTHIGSNTMFCVVAWLAPERNFALVVATNAGVDVALSGCDEAAGMLIKTFLKD